MGFVAGQPDKDFSNYFFIASNEASYSFSITVR